MTLTEQRQKNRTKWAQIIRKKRKQHKLSQEELARESKYTLAYLQSIENGRCCSQHAFEHFLEILTGIRKRERKTA